MRITPQRACARDSRSAVALLCVIAISFMVSANTVPVSTVGQLVAAVNNGSAGDTVMVAAGAYSLTATLSPKARMTIKGAGRDSTILRPASSWTPGLATAVEPINWNGVTTSAYFFYLGSNDGVNSVTISDMTMDGQKRLQGAVCGRSIDDLTIHDVYFHDFTFCGVRVIGGTRLVVHSCEFVNMAVSGMDPEAGAVVFAWLSHSEFYNNQFYFATHGVYYGSGVNAGNFYGYKGRGLSDSRIHHNTILVNFSIELPFDDIANVDVDHNNIAGWISIPKYAGGSVPTSGVRMRVHHNYISSAVVAEYPRNSVEIDHNLLDNPRSEAGSMLSGWTSELAPGPTRMHDNLIKNLGRVLADVGLYNGLQFYNNNVNAPANAGATTEVLFIVDGNIDRSSFVFRDNIVNCTGHPRDLLWSDLGAGFTSIENNTLTSVTDQANYANPSTGATRGPLEPLYFTCGAPGNAFCVDQWSISSGACASTRVVQPAPQAPAVPFDVCSGPAGSSASIKYRLTESGAVKIALYDLLGKQVLQLVNGTQNAGEHTADINTRLIQKRVYLVRMTVKGQQYAQALAVR